MSPVSMSPSTSTSSSRPAASSSGSSKLRLRQTARPSELILLAVTQLLSVAYAVVVLPSRSSVPAFLPELSDILDPYIVNAPLALVWSCAGLAVVQTYTGYRFAVWSGRVTPAEGANDPPLLVWSKAWEIVTAILFIATLLFLAIISLGAPVSRKLLETGLLSLFLALLAFGPAAWVIRPLVPGKPSPPSAWTRLFALMNPTTDTELMLVCNAWSTIFGALLGALPIPLDWEMPWQTWPIPVLVGALAGWVCGQLLGPYLCIRSIYDHSPHN